MQKILAEEAALIARVLVDKDQHAFSILVKHYQQSVRQYCRRLCAPDHTIADDIAQETFLQAYKKLAMYEGRGKFIGWLFRIAYFQYLQMLRSKKQYDELDDAQHCEGFTTTVDNQQDLEKAMAQLTIHERTCITLQFSFGYSQQEIVELIDMPLGTVKSHVKRGKDKLELILNMATKPSHSISGAA